jgi:hypothetical protein
MKRSNPAEHMNQDKEKWYLRKRASEKVFGPVNLDDLVQWAEHGRIEPDDEVSNDEKTWKSAESVSDLGLCWMVELPSGELSGPVNIRTVCDLVTEGVINPDCKVQRQNSDSFQVVGLALAEVLTELLERHDPVPDPQPIRDEVQALEVRLEELQTMQNQLRAHNEHLLQQAELRLADATQHGEMLVESAAQTLHKTLDARRRARSASAKPIPPRRVRGSAPRRATTISSHNIRR